MPWRSIILMFSTGIFTIIQFLYQSFTSSLLEPDRPLPTVHTSNSGASRSMFICHPQSGEIYWRSFGLVAAFQIVVNHAKVPAALQQCSSNSKQGKFSLTWSISDLRLHSLHELVDYSAAWSSLAPNRKTGEYILTEYYSVYWALSEEQQTMANFTWTFLKFLRWRPRLNEESPHSSFFSPKIGRSPFKSVQKPRRPYQVLLQSQVELHRLNFSI